MGPVPDYTSLPNRQEVETGTDDHSCCSRIGLKDSADCNAGAVRATRSEKSFSNRWADGRAGGIGSCDLGRSKVM
jgi:hypothetical protein